MDQFFGGGGEESLFSRLGRTLAELLQTLPENVHIFSAGDAGLRGQKALNVWFAAHGSPYYREEKLRGYVAANRAKVRTAVEPEMDRTRVKNRGWSQIERLFKCFHHSHVTAAGRQFKYDP